jgi:hypothetical protein
MRILKYSTIIILAFHLTAEAQVVRPDIQYFNPYLDTQVCDGLNFFTSRLMYLKFGTQELRQHGCELDAPLHVEDQRASYSPAGDPVNDWFKLDVKNRSVSGSASIHSIYNKGGGNVHHGRDIYADAVPAASVRVEISYSLMAYGNPDGQGGLRHGAAVSFGDISRSVVDTIAPQVGVIVADVSPYTTTKIVNGKTYYKLGSISLSGNIGGGGSDYIFGAGAFSAQVTGIQAYYNGNVITKAAGNNGDSQTWMVNEELPVPISVKVSHGVTGAAAANKDIAFALQYPNNTTVSLGAVRTDINGIASKKVTLGNDTGIYRVIANCPASVCVSGVREVVFAEYAKTREEVTELSVVQCEKYAAKNDKIYNAFIVRAFNTLTHKAEQGLTVNFDKDAFPNGAVGQKVLPGSAITNKDGIAFASMWTGDVSGGYAYKAECPDCQGNQLEHCVVLADLPPFMEAAPKDEGPVAGDPNETPMLRIVNIGYPDANDRVSFTTLPNENKIDLVAEVSPANLAGDIQWKVEDSEDDHVVSGNPGLTLPLGPESSFLAMAPAAPSGRPGPLEYKVQASVVTPKGLVKSYPRYVKQDVIDKCRQEYVDFGVPWEEVGRNRFSVGGSEYSVDIVDCYAYIYPDERAGQLSGLRSQINEFFVKVTSGYRSPRGNRKAGSKSNLSKHLFGDAVDIAPRPVDVNGSNMKLLWNLSPTPKLLEKGASIILRSWETPTNDTVFKHVDHVHIGN